MKIKQKPLITTTKSNQTFACIEIPNQYVDELNKIMKHDDITVEIIKTKVKRSHTANSYLWVLCTLIAEKINLPKGDVYVKMIKRYGIYHEMTAKDEVLTTLIKVWDDKNTSVEHTESLCEITNSFRSKGIVWHELHCYEGSSDYNSVVFSKLLKGVVDECEILKIETLPPDEIKRMIDMIEEGK